VTGVSVVIPSVGRASLADVLAALADRTPAGSEVEVLVVDDRRERAEPLPLSPGAKVLAGPGVGPAAARNTGWHAARHPWVVFLDDDVLPDADWLARLDGDLDVPEDVGGVQGRVRVPLPAHRPPTDWERNTYALSDGKWITADMAYRRGALAAVGGFDERFPRAYREDAELAHRVAHAGWRLVVGRRWVTHPVRPEGPWVSLRLQRGNADDALLRRLYGRRWRQIVDVPRGRRPRHSAVTLAGAAALLCGALAAGSARRRRIWRYAAGVTAAGWLAGTAEFAGARLRPGPRHASEVATVLVTSVLIPPLACTNWLRGWLAWRGAPPPCRGLR
jgi:glycosyltransferase involved in cell wall biosynthesis